MTRFGGRGLALIIALFCLGLGLAAPAFAAAPTITSFTPTSGPLHTTITITGTNFAAPATVKVNGVAASSPKVVSPTTITATLAAASSTGRVTVTTPGGAATSTGTFTVTPGSTLSASAGPPGSTPVFYFGGMSAYEAVDVYVDSHDVALVSASSTGVGSVTVTVPAATPPGTHWVTAVGRHSGNSAQSAFTVQTNWPQYGGNAGHTGANPSEGTLSRANATKLAQTWKVPLSTSSDYSYAAPVVAGGVVYTPSESGVTATSLSTGATKWAQVLGQVTGSIAVYGGIVVVGTISGHLIGLDAGTGTVRYNFGFSGEYFYEPITVVGGVGYTQVTQNSSSASIIAFDMSSGAQDWSYPLNTYCFGTAVSNGTLWTTCNNEHLLALNAANGQVRYDIDATSYEHEATPVIANGLVFSAGFDATNDGSVLLAYDADSGDLAWARPVTLQLSPSTSLAVADDELFVDGIDGSTGQATVAAFAAADGSPLWSVAQPEIDYYGLTAANGLLFVPGTSIAALDVATGTVVTKVRGSQFAVPTDAGLVTAISATALVRYALPTSAYPPAVRPAPAALHPDRSLRLQR